MMLGISLLSTQLALGRSRPRARSRMRWWLVANNLGLACLCTLYFIGFKLRAPVSDIVPRLLIGVGLALLFASAFVYVRNDARRLREKAAQPGQ
jgi:phosphoglycerol transferase MdoB-like AlkP superfamily enzyme